MTTPEPRPRAVERHQQQTRNDSPATFDQLHALAGRWDRYPVCAPTPAMCPSCGGELPPLAAYCSDDCRKLAIKRSFRNLAHDPDPLPGYSYPPPESAIGGTMTPEELQPCAMCGRGVMHAGMPVFWRVSFERMGVDLGAVQRMAGLEMMLGNVALARVFSPDRAVATPLSASHTVLVCEECAAQPTTVYRLGFPKEGGWS